MPQYKPRERKHRRRESEQRPAAKTENPNDAIIVPPTSSERDARRKQLKAELAAQQGENKMSSKKKKRLEHYIETKLKKDEAADLIKKLSAHKIDTDLLQSSKRLGQVTETRQNAFRRALKEREAGIDVDGDQEDILFTQRTVADPEDFHTVAPQPVVPAEVPVPPTSLFGAGLKRSLDTNGEGQQVIKRRKREKKPSRFAKQEVEEVAEPADSPEPEWSGFDEDEAEDEVLKDAPDTEVETSEEDSEDSDEASDEVDESDDDSNTSEDGSQPKRNLARVSAFKQWAESQRNDALGFVPSTAPVIDETVKANFRPREASPDPAQAALQTIDTSRLARPKHALTIDRTEDMQKARSALPVVHEEQRIMEAVHNNPVVIVCGATGSGKTTQVPQMLFESGYGSLCGTGAAPSQSTGMIGVTQPRRVAAVSVADRVATELGVTYKAKVGHQVRYDSSVSRQTAIKFMTDGILLREIHEDFILSKYSAIVIDEAHERSVNTDILIGTLSRIVNLRDELAKEKPEQYYPLKLIVMSATLRVADFAQNHRLFRGLAPPIVEAEGRQYPVTIHFARITHRDYVADIVKKVSRGHKKLPPGGMLVFLTGQNEINTAARLLKQAFGDTSGPSHNTRARESADQVPLEDDDFDIDARNAAEGEDSDADLDGFDNDDEDDFDLGEEEGVGAPRLGTAHSVHAHILPLYAALPTAQQMRIFQPTPADSRLIVLATNVAETSLTIPGIRYVFDCGRSKEKKYDAETGVQQFEIDWISQASAAQRTGRAGRTGPGHCWRLYSSAIFENYFSKHSLPEIQRTPIEGTVLQLKAMNVDNVVNFPFPTPPDRSQLQAAEMLLANLGALSGNGKITSHGRALMQYPVSPRFSKMLLLASSNGILEHTIAVVAGMAVGDLFIPEMQTTITQDEDNDSDDDRRQRHRMAAQATTEAQQRHQAYGRAKAMLSRWDDRSDVIKVLTAVAAHADAMASGNASKICDELFLREKGMAEVQQLRQQLHTIVRVQHRHTSVSPFKLGLSLPEVKERKMLNQIVAAGYLDQVAIRADLLPGAAGIKKARSAIDVPYRPLFPLTDIDFGASEAEQQEQRSIYVHPSSILARLSKSELPSYVVYSHLSRAALKVVGGQQAKTRMHPLTTISAKALAALARDTPLLETGKPIGKIEDCNGGKSRTCHVSLVLRAPGVTAADEWPLGSQRVEQDRDRKGNWRTTKVLS